MEVDHEVAHDLGEVHRQRGAALPELEDTVLALHQPFEECLEDIIDILPVGARADAVIDQLAVVPIKGLDRARRCPKDVVDQFNIGQFGRCGGRCSQSPSPGDSLTS